MLGGMDPALCIDTPRLWLCLPDVDWAPVVADFQRRNRAHFAPWDPPRAEAYYSDGFWHDALAKGRQDCVHEQSLRLFLIPKARPQTVIGFANFSNIMRGPFQACYLGYGLDAQATGSGLMTEALQAAVDAVFAGLKLHRIMANYVPENERSARVLQRLGFTIEGLARDYLYINGRWRDHVLTAKVHPAAPVPSGS